MNSLRPAQLWRKDGMTASHIHDVVNSQPFKSALTFALAEYTLEVGPKSDAGARIIGATDFIGKLLNIGVEPAERKILSFNLPIDEPKTE